MKKIEIGGCAIPTIYEFGPFRLDAQGETLFRGSEPVVLSQRAVALLRMLVDRAGAPVTKGALIEGAWPGLAIEDSNLTVQIAALRRGGRRSELDSYAAPQGLSLVGPAVTKSEALVRTTPTGDPTLTSFIRRDAPGAKTRVSGQPQTLPAQLTRMVGREDSVQSVTEALSAHRFVTIVGPGGIGKTTVATAAAHALSPAFDAQIAFVDLGPLGEPRLVLGAIASTLGVIQLRRSDRQLDSIFAELCRLKGEITLHQQGSAGSEAATEDFH